MDRFSRTRGTQRSPLVETERHIDCYSYSSYYSSMKEIPAREAKNRFGLFLDAAQRVPVRVTKNGRAVGVMMSVTHYERLRGAAWEHLATTMDALGTEAASKGLTEAGLTTLLADES